MIFWILKIWESKIQKTIDTATAEVLKQAGNVKEEALKQVDKAKGRSIQADG